jgi:predicted lipid-binding transport protein (Tim44 family)
MDIILLSLLSAFIAYRLWNVLGTRTGNEKKRDWTNADTHRDTSVSHDNVILLPQRGQNIKSEQDDNALAQREEEHANVLALMPDFSVDAFLKGAVRAFEKIVTSYATGNIDTLKKLLKAEVFSAFSRAIENRQQKNERMEAHIESIEAEIDNMRVYDDCVHIVVRFTSDQMIATFNTDGVSYDNPAQLRNTTTDIWTFERSLSSLSSIWLLSKTDTIHG